LCVEPVAAQLHHRRTHRVWVGRLARGRGSYHAVLIDWYARTVFGYVFDDEMPAQLCVDAWSTAVRKRRLGSGLACHADRCSQYASKECLAALDDVGRGWVKALNNDIRFLPRASLERKKSQLRLVGRRRGAWRCRSVLRLAGRFGEAL